MRAGRLLGAVCRSLTVAVRKSVPALMTIGVLYAQTAPEKVQVSKTETVDFPAGGVLHLMHAVGELTITGWDQPNVEITTIKASKTVVDSKNRAAADKLLESVKVATERKGDELTVTTEFPRHSKIERPFLGMTDFDLEYRIRAPRGARLEIDAAMGEIHIDNIAGDIRATENLGQITVRVPDGAYSIDAKSKLGAVESDFPGNERRVKWVGHAFVGNPPAATQKLFLRVTYGDIAVLKVH